MKQMKMRTVRTAGLVGGLATGALLLAGTAAQAADSVEESTGDLVTATPEALGGLPVSPDAVTGMASGVTDKVPGLSAVSAVPGLNMLVPAGPDAEAKTDKPAENPNKGGQDEKPQDEEPQGGPLDALPVGDLLGGLGGGLPVPLPF
ncbi:hypothetical protein GCM10009830_03670 [Glycomyces endophyticus]|uniref:ATP-binding protein n=1 Tax=Glycomyces endophyticus TaxID=480996 RepID=A0ABN2FXW7_9ACTN